jgi:hypothetical protein
LNKQEKTMAGIIPLELGADWLVRLFKQLLKISKQEKEELEKLGPVSKAMQYQPFQFGYMPLGVGAAYNKAVDFKGDVTASPQSEFIDFSGPSFRVGPKVHISIPGESSAYYGLSMRVTGMLLDMNAALPTPVEFKVAKGRFLGGSLARMAGLL